MKRLLERASSTRAAGPPAVGAVLRGQVVPAPGLRSVPTSR